MRQGQVNAWQRPDQNTSMNMRNRETQAGFPGYIAVLGAAAKLLPARQFLRAMCQAPMDFIQLQALPQHGQACLMVVLPF
jgi:hypothetical protein